MKIFLFLLSVTCNFVYSQQLIFIENGDSLSLNSKIYYDSTKKEKRIETYLNGNLIKSQAFYEKNQIKYEANYRGDTVLSSFSWYETGIIRSIRLFAGDTIRETVYYNELGKIVEYDSFRKGKRIIRTYDWHDNTLATEFFCDYSKNKQCAQIDYYSGNNILSVFISKPLRFLKADSAKVAKINRSIVMDQRYPIKATYYEEDGTIKEKFFFKKGIINKSIEYFRKGRIVKYYDDNKNVIKTRIIGKVESNE
jgi:hypothetical protein